MQEVSGSIPLSSTTIQILAFGGGFLFVSTSYSCPCGLSFIIVIPCDRRKKAGNVSRLIKRVDYSTSAAIDADSTLTSVEP